MYTIEEIKNRIEPIAKKYNIPLVSLFGSYARGEATEKSDLDFIIKRKGSSLKSVFDMGGLYAEVSAAFKPVSVDLITYETLHQHGDRKVKYLKIDVEKDQKVIYEKQ